MNIWQVIIGVLTALFVIYFRHAQVTAQKQKIVATRLRSYLLYWRGWILDNDFFSVFYLGVEWNKEIQEIMKKGGGAKDLVKLNEEKKEMVKKIKEKIETESNKQEFDKENIIDRINKIPKNMSDSILQYALKNNQNLIEGKTLISDEDASYLGAYIAQICVEMKMNLISMTDQGVALLLSILQDPEAFDIKESAKDITDIIWKAILVSKDIDILSNRIENISSLTLFALTLRNLRKGL